MSQYKALALDIDGTLLNTKKEVTTEVLKEVRRLQEESVPVMIASGRPHEGIRHVAKAIGMDVYGGFVLSFNGGKITEFKSGHVVYNKTVPIEYNDEILDYVKSHIPEAAVLTYDDGEIITENPEEQYVQLESRVVKMPVRKVENLKAEVDFPVNKFLVTGAPELLEKAVKEMAEHFAGRLNVFQSEPFFIEVVSLGIDKAQSLDYLLKQLGLHREELVACGDGGNDITMVCYAGMGVAMANARDEVKEAADYVTASCDENGVALAIQKFFH